MDDRLVRELRRLRTDLQRLARLAGRPPGPLQKGRMDVAAAMLGRVEDILDLALDAANRETSWAPSASEPRPTNRS